MNTSEYLEEVQRHLKTGSAREHTYRPAVEKLFTSFEDIQAANDQARTEHGATDFVFYKKSNTQIILGYAEAKDIDANLDKTEKTEQLERYAGYDNLILTNYIEFRFYKNGKKYESIEIAKLDKTLNTLELIPENYSKLQDEIQAFFDQPPEKIKSAKRLSEIMGAKARRVRSNIEILLGQHEKDNSKAKDIAKIYQLMREMLVHDMTPADFADMYAQTLVYGLFVARYNDTESPENFTRQEARDLVPASNPFLREFFDHITGPHFERRLEIIVDELCEVFAVSNVHEIIDKYIKSEESKNDSKDPILHFYEDFLAEYDPAMRKSMGAYYTPLPVVNFMVRAVDEVLKTHFGVKDGLADSSTITQKVQRQGKSEKMTYHKVQVLDPATGTATFLNQIIKFVATKFEGQQGLWPTYARDSLVPRLNGFELMMGAYTIAHLKLGLTLNNLGVNDLGERLRIFLTNSLEEGVPQQPDLFGSFGLAGAVTSEAEEAARVKSERPIMVVIGNPPYSGVSSNNFEHANRMIDKYKVEPGGKLKLQERNPKMLNDDYVKFISFSEDMIAKNGEGVLAFITNHGYLDNPTFRGMRWHLTQTFDDIQIIDLHGNAKKKETAPDGSKDENVFDIQQGVAIVIATKLKGNNKKDAKVRAADLYGTRKAKFDSLNNGDIKFVELNLDKELYYLVDKNTEGKKEYKKYFSVEDIFNAGNVGVVTSSDKNLIKFASSDLEDGVRAVSSRVQYTPSFSRSYDYRPFDTRFVYYDTALIGRARLSVMKNMISSNVALQAGRLNRGVSDGYFYVTENITDRHILDSAGDSISTFPLWLYDEQGNKSSNLNPEIVKQINSSAPEADEQGIFDYIYGVLHWPAYREKYKEFLKIDFPRVPYPKDSKEFEHFRAKGERLRQLHLMKASDVDELITTYPEVGSNIVENSLTAKQPGWVAGEGDMALGKVWINSSQYFGGVPKIAWEFYIGGYQPAQKWLKDRKNRQLSTADIMHYQRIIKVLTETHKTMEDY